MIIQKVLKFEKLCLHGNVSLFLLPAVVPLSQHWILVLLPPFPFYIRFCNSPDWSRFSSTLEEVEMPKYDNGDDRGA